MSIWYEEPPWYMRLWKRLKQTDLGKILTVLENYKLITTPQIIDIVKHDDGEQYVSLSGGYMHHLTAKCNIQFTGDVTCGDTLNCEKNFMMGTPPFVDFSNKTVTWGFKDTIMISGTFEIE